MRPRYPALTALLAAVTRCHLQSWDEDPLTSKCKGTRIRNALEYLQACAQLQVCGVCCMYASMVSPILAC